MQTKLIEDITRKRSLRLQPMSNYGNSIISKTEIGSSWRSNTVPSARGNSCRQILLRFLGRGLLDRPSFPLRCGDTFPGAGAHFPLWFCGHSLRRLGALLELRISGPLRCGHFPTSGGTELLARSSCFGRSGCLCAATVQYASDL